MFLLHPPTTLPTTTTGVAVFGGNWRQSAPANLAISGPTGSAGACTAQVATTPTISYLTASSRIVWSTGVQTSLAAIGSSSGDAGTWVQEAPVSINWSGTTGHGFSCKEAGDWRCLTDDLTGLVGGTAPLGFYPTQPLERS
jgi:hypothetical protein